MIATPWWIGPVRTTKLLGRAYLTDGHREWCVFEVPPTTERKVPSQCRKPQTFCPSEIRARAREKQQGKAPRCRGYFDGIPDDPQDAEAVVAAWAAAGVTGVFWND